MKQIAYNRALTCRRRGRKNAVIRASARKTHHGV